MDEPTTDSGRLPRLATSFAALTVTLILLAVVSYNTSSVLPLVVATAVAIVAFSAVFALAVARPTIDSLAIAEVRDSRSSSTIERLRDDVAHLTAQREREARERLRLGRSVTLIQNEIDREITDLRFVVEDLTEAEREGRLDSFRLNRLEDGLHRVSTAQSHLTALNRLGTKEHVERIDRFTASDLRPVVEGLTVVVEWNDPIHGQTDLWRLFVHLAARNASLHGRATTFRLASRAGQLILSDDGRGSPPAELDRVWTSGLRSDGTKSDGFTLMRRIAEAHGAQVTLEGGRGIGVRIVVDLNDLEIDLRDRRVVSQRLSTPAKHRGSVGSTPAPN